MKTPRKSQEPSEPKNNHEELDYSSIFAGVENVEEKNEPALKETQGQRKMRQYLEDLRRNKKLLAKIKILDKKWTLEKKSGRKSKFTVPEFLAEIADDYRALLKKCEPLGDTVVGSKFYNEMAARYGIDSDLFLAFALPEMLEKPDLLVSYETDMCLIGDNFQERFDPAMPDFPLELQGRGDSNIIAYPIRIDVHKYASKRDVLDYVEKRWVLIEKYLKKYRGQKKRFRTRKIDRKMTDFLWQNKDEQIKAIKRSLDKQFPHNGLMYYEIAKLISIEKQRRSGKLL